MIFVMPLAGDGARLIPPSVMADRAGMYRPGHAYQDGVALILALLVTALAVTLVTGLFWPQQVQVRANENQQLQLQMRWLLRGALDDACRILHQDGLSSGGVTTLAGAWALPMASAGRNDTLGRERAPDAAPATALSGRIIDAQSRYNLANLASGGQVSLQQMLVYDRLLRLLRLDPALADRTARALADTGAVPLRQLGDLLAIPGYTPQAVDALREFAVVLPEQTAVNANTASAELLAAALDLPLAQAVALAASRNRAWLRDAADLASRLQGKQLDANVRVDVRSNYFLAMVSVRFERTALDAQALIRRQLGGRVPVALDRDDRAPTSLVWIRRR